MLTLLHTSDLHLGHSLYGHDRSAEQTAMLDAIIGVAAVRMPDAVLICGDVFDVAAPSAAIQTLFVEKVEELRRRCPDTAIVITAGNHDSGTRHEIFRSAWLGRGIHLVGTCSTDTPDRAIVEIPGKGFIVAVPYVHSSRQNAAFYNCLLGRCEARNTGSLPVVLMAHAAVAGSDFSANISDTEGERVFIGNLAVMDAEDLGTGYDYAALGHIHKPQTLAGGRVRYCGTPLPVSFDESHTPAITWVEIDRHGALPRIEEMALEGGFRRLRTIPSAGACSMEHALELLRLLPADCRDYIRLNICQEAPPGSAGDTAAREALAHTRAIYCLCNYTAPVQVRENPFADGALSVRQMQARHPASIAADYARSRGIDFEDLRDLFDIACADAEREEEES